MKEGSFRPQTTNVGTWICRARRQSDRQWRTTRYNSVMMVATAEPLAAEPTAAEDVVRVTSRAAAAAAFGLAPLAGDSK